MNLKDKIKNIIHKAGVNPSDWDKVNKKLLIILEYVIDHCHTHNLPLIITSIIRPKIKGVSVSDTHAEGRAFDVSVRGWSIEDIKFLQDAINEALTIGAISMKDGKERECRYEPDEFKMINGKRVQVKWAHLHFQCAR